VQTTFLYKCHGKCSVKHEDLVVRFFNLDETIKYSLQKNTREKNSQAGWIQKPTLTVKYHQDCCSVVPQRKAIHLMLDKTMDG
jgi:hypothetical protein